jgi:heptosyltransferase-2
MKYLVRVPNWIGDCLLAVPAIRSLQHSDPEAEIWITAKDWVKDLFLRYPFVKGTVSLPPPGGGLRGLGRFAGTLREQGFDTALLLTNSFGSALPFALARIRNRWGYSSDGRRPLLTRSIRLGGEEHPAHQVYYYLNLVSAMGAPPLPPSLDFPLHEDEITWAAAFLSQQGLSLKDTLVVLNPGGYYGSAKRWPAASFGALAARLQADKGAQIVIVGTQHESPLAESISNVLSVPPMILTGRTTLRQLAAVISRADLMVTNDSGPMHLANALQVPVVALFGPTDPRVTAPFQEPSTWLHNQVPCWPCSYRDCPFDHRCMMSLSPAEVYEACLRWLT